MAKEKKVAKKKATAKKETGKKRAGKAAKGSTKKAAKKVAAARKVKRTHMLSIDDCWAFLESEVGGASALPAGASEESIKQAELTMGVAFPEDFRRHLQRHDGSDPHFISPYKIGGGGQGFLAVSDIVQVWKHMVKSAADVGDDFECEPSGPIKPHYWNKQWIPFTDNQCGDHIFLDLDPPKAGTLGQIVDWWHEQALSTFQSSSLREWMNEVVAEVKKGVYKFGSGDD